MAEHKAMVLIIATVSISLCVFHKQDHHYFDKYIAIVISFEKGQLFVTR